MIYGRMRTLVLVCLLSTALFADAGAEATQRSAIFLFGPAGADQGRQAARVAAVAARQWAKEAGSAAELRRAGSAEAMPLDPKASAKPIEEAFLNAAKLARDTDPETFLTSLDAAAQALVQRHGLRLLVTIVENLPLSTDGENTLTQLIAFCRSNGVRVVILDPGEKSTKNLNDLWRKLGDATGGAFVRQSWALADNIKSASAQSRLTEAPEPAHPAAKPPAVAVAASLPSDLPVHVRFIHTGFRAGATFGTEQMTSISSPNVTNSGVSADDGVSAMRGLLLVESPMNAVQFNIDDNSGTYDGRARMTQIVRNASGKIVWQASKLVNLHGPLRKLDVRRQGNLYFMRNVVLSAGQYTIEGKIEDLSTGKSGAAREPLRAASHLASLNMSDALIIRPFNAAVDRLEADQVLEHDGAAFSPLLSPVYKADEPFDLQIFFVMYPDIYGAKPELSLEILRDGKVVGRSALPFPVKLMQESAAARNYGTTTIGGNGGTPQMMNQRKRDFPYVATLRGVRLQGGDYEGRVTVQQGSAVLSRIIEFHVIGKAPVQVAGKSAGSTAPAVDEADFQVKLPEVDPVQLDVANTLPAEEQQKLWQEAVAGALSYTARLPNFRCNRETHRLVAPLKSPDAFRQSDEFVEELIYENNRETYRTLEVNGQRSGISREGLKGVSSSGEFGGMLTSTFEPAVGARYKWAGHAMSGGVLCDVFEIEVPQKKSHFGFTLNSRREVAAVHGRVFVDQESGLVRRITVQGTDLPKDFGLQSPVLSLEYGSVRIGDKDYVLPLRSVLQVREGKQVVRNETQFRDYRRFESSVDIRYQ